MADDAKWDDEDETSETLVTKVSDRWEGEDDDENVKDNWDDDDDEPAEQTEKKVTSGQSGPKSKKKQLAEAIAKKEAASLTLRKPETADEILADKLAKQRLQEESDLKVAIESFGLTEGSISREGLDEIRKQLVEKLKIAEKSIHYSNFLESTFRDLCAALDAEDIKRIGSNLITLSNEKLKASKNAKKKKKGAAIRVERSDLDYDDGHEYDDFM